MSASASGSGSSPSPTQDGVEERRVGLGVVGARGRPPSTMRVALARASAVRSGMPARSSVSSTLVAASSWGSVMPTASKSTTGRAALEGEQRQALGAHEVGRVSGAGRKARSAAMPPDGVHGVHEDAHGLVGLAQLVGVRVDHAEGGIAASATGAAQPHSWLQVARPAVRHPGEQSASSRDGHRSRHSHRAASLAQARLGPALPRRRAATATERAAALARPPPASTRTLLARAGRPGGLARRLQIARLGHLTASSRAFGHHSDARPDDVAAGLEVLDGGACPMASVPAIPDGTP